MSFRPLFVALFVVGIVLLGSCASCQGGQWTIGGSSGPDASENTPDGGDGGVSWTDKDAGVPSSDGTQTQTIEPGGFVLDGGSQGTGNGVTLTPEGHIAINSGSIEFHFMWIANNELGWVSKYDTRTGKEVGRYFSVIPKDCANSAGPPCAGGNTTSLRGNQANNPSRTAVDLFGDVWVANRAVSIQGSATKIANARADCIDRNGDGLIQTSSDLNGDGIISTVRADKEMILPTDFSNPNEYDECVLFSTPLGTPRSGVAGRAIAVSLGGDETAGDVWYGDYRERRVYKLNPRNGQPAPLNASGATFLELGDFDGPYGAVIDGEQRLWLVAIAAARLALIDTRTGTLISNNIVPPAGTRCGAYGIGADGKNRIWLPGLYAGAVACRYDHGTGISSTQGNWTSFDFSAARTLSGHGPGRPRGIAADDSGNIYMSMDYDNSAQGNVSRLIRFDAETGAIKPFNNPSGTIQVVDATNSKTNLSIGISLDSDGHPWINNYSGNAMRVHRVTGELLLTEQQPQGLYTYSDFTGYQLRKFTAPRGTYTRDVWPCSNVRWLSLTWDASTPPNTQIKTYVRLGDDLSTLANGTRYGPFLTSPVDLSAQGWPEGKPLRLEFELTTSDGKTSPLLKGFQIKWECPLG